MSDVSTINPIPEVPAVEAPAVEPAPDAAEIQAIPPLLPHGVGVRFEVLGPETYRLVLELSATDRADPVATRRRELIDRPLRQAVAEVTATREERLAYHRLREEEAAAKERLTAARVAFRRANAEHELAETGPAEGMAARLVDSSDAVSAAQGVLARAEREAEAIRPHAAKALEQWQRLVYEAAREAGPHLVALVEAKIKAIHRDMVQAVVVHLPALLELHRSVWRLGTEDFEAAAIDVVYERPALSAVEALVLLDEGSTTILADPPYLAETSDALVEQGEGSIPWLEGSAVPASGGAGEPAARRGRGRRRVGGEQAEAPAAVS